jgi:PKD repeat protein
MLCYPGYSYKALFSQLKNTNFSFKYSAMKYLYLFTFCILIAFYSQGQNIINTMAGTGAAMYTGDGGPATAATINNPIGVAADDAGNLYISDVFNHVIRKVNVNGTITTIAGNGTQGYSGDNGQALLASLNWPVDVVLDNQNNLYICDYMGQAIRKLNMTTGIITTVAGTGVGGYNGDNIQATLSNVNFPTELALDGTFSNLYFTDQANDRIRKVNLTTGVIYTVAGTGVAVNSGDGGLATAASINHPYGIAIDPSGNIFFSAYSNNSVRKIDAVTGNISNFAGNGSGVSSGDGGPATLAGFSFTEGICSDSVGNIYIAELSGAHIRKVDVVTGIVSTIAGNGQTTYSGDGGDPLLASMWPCAVEVRKGKVYIADLNNRIRVIRNAAPSFYVTPVTQSTVFCYGDSTGSVTVQGLNGGLPYQYKIGNGPYQNSGTFSGLPAGTYIITAKDSNGATTTVTITITQQPPISVTTIPTGTINLCQTGLDSIYIAVQNNGVTFDCEWTDGTQGTYIYLSEPGTYNVTCHDGFGCPATSADIIITNTGLPVANFTYSQIDNYHVNFTSTSSNANSYQWSFSSGDTSTNQNPTGINYIVEGTYSATLIVNNNCGTDTITLPVIVDKLSGVNENNALSTFNLYPNPANGSATIKLEATKPIKAQLTILTVDGRLVYTEDIAFNATYAKTIDLAGVAAGVYIINLTGNDINLNRKLIVEK